MIIRIQPVTAVWKGNASIERTLTESAGFGGNPKNKFKSTHFSFNATNYSQKLALSLLKFAALSMANSPVNRISQRNRNRKRAPRQCAQSFQRERKPIEIVVNDCMGLLDLWYSRRRWFELKPGTAKCDRNEFVIDLLALRWNGEMATEA